MIPLGKDARWVLYDFRPGQGSTWLSWKKSETRGTPLRLPRESGRKGSAVDVCVAPVPIEVLPGLAICGAFDHLRGIRQSLDLIAKAVTEGSRIG